MFPKELNKYPVLTDLFTLHGPPEHIGSDNGSELTVAAVRDWLERVEIQTLFTRQGCPWGETRRLS